MKLRLKIFISIGGLFLSGFVISQYLEDRVFSKNLILEEKKLQETIISQDELRRQNIERYVRSNLDQEKEKILVLFSKIQNLPWLYARYAPTIDNAKNGTWLQSASLIDTNKWIDFIQNTNEGLLTSQIVIDENNSKESVIIYISPEMNLCVTRDLTSDAKWEGPYVSIPYDYEEVTFDGNNYINESSINPNQDNGYSLLFPPKVIKEIDVQKLRERLTQIQEAWKKQGVNFEPSSNYYQILAILIDRVQSAKNYLNSQSEFFQNITSDKKDEYISKLLSKINIDCQAEGYIHNPSSTAGLSRRFDQIVNIWQLTTLLSTKIFGPEPFDEGFPVGISQVAAKSTCGNAFMNIDILFDQLNVYTKKFQGRLGIFPEISFIIYKDVSDRLYFGGVLTLIDKLQTGELRRGTLTLGIDAKWIVRNLSLAANATTLFYSGGQLLVGYDSKGEKIDVDKIKESPIGISNDKTGFLKFEGEDYFYLQIKPYPDLDMDFYIIFPKDKEFALITVLNKTAKNLIQKISTQMNLIVISSLIIILFFLNNIIKHILQPVSILAGACEQLKAGKLKEIELPELKKNKKDEVHTLYNSFKSMIIGLKEKEKVMGVLNKVVSPSIAQEILKGKIHLGGEEKIVTVLFADIRNFTKITEKMPPHEVIDLLNTCMTKVSHVVDKHEGVIDKYVGDEVMALFGAPIPIKNAPEKALECAVEIHAELEKWNQERTKKGLPKVEMGIGIHTGLVVAGNMGAEDRLNYTVLGSNVNLAARICSYCPPGQIVVTMGTVQFQNILENFEVEALPPVEFKGFSEPVQIYKILNPQKKKT